MTNAIPRNLLSAFLFVMYFVVAITGVMLYFKIRILSSQTIHIWLGFAFALISILHLVKNWSGFAMYFKKRSTFLAIIVSCLIVGAFMAYPFLNPQPKGVNPKGKVLGAMVNTSLLKLADFTDIEVQVMLKNLASEKMLASATQSISEIARANQKSNDEVLAIAFRTPSQ